MRRIFIIALIFAAAMGAARADASPPRIAFLNPGAKGEAFWELLSKGMQAAADQLGFELEVVWAERNKKTMRELGIQIARRDNPPTYLVIVNEEDAAAPVLAAAEAAGVTTIFLANPLSDDGIRQHVEQHGAIKHLLGSMVYDMQPAGARMADRLVAAAASAKLAASDSRLHLLGLGGDEITASSVARNAGLMSVVATRTDVVVDRLLFANWNRTEAMSLTSRFIELMKRRGLRLAGVWAGNDSMAIGAISALRSAGLQPGSDVFVVGLNWSPEAIGLLRSGELLMTDGGHFFSGAWLVVMLRDHIAGCTFGGGPAPQTIKLKTDALDKNTSPALLDLISKQAFEQLEFSSFLAHPRGCGRYDFNKDALVRALRSR